MSAPCARRKSMKDEFELRIGPGGIIESIYQDGLAEAIGAETKTVERASNVEWESDGKNMGWTVRCAADPHLALRRMRASTNTVASKSFDLDVIFFQTREEALKEEVEHFWELYACQHHKVVGCMICRYGEPPKCPVCGAGPDQDCDAGLHS